MLSASYAERIGAFIAGSVAQELPRAVVEKAKRHVLDTFGAALAGATSDEARATRAMLSAAEGGGPAAAWGTRLTLSPRNAALANGVAAHAFELDDTGGCDHSGAVVLPASVAALALASPPTTGMEFLLAVVLGYDIGRRVLEAFGGYQAHNGAGWHSTGTCGVFGAAAAACRILRLDPSQCVAAIGLAASFAGGLWAFIHDGSQAKRIHAGRAAEGGLLAALLAGARRHRPAPRVRRRVGRASAQLCAWADGRGGAGARARRIVENHPLRDQALRLLPRHAQRGGCGRPHHPAPHAFGRRPGAASRCG